MTTENTAGRLQEWLKESELTKNRVPWIKQLARSQLQGMSFDDAVDELYETTKAEQSKGIETSKKAESSKEASKGVSAKGKMQVKSTFEDSEDSEDNLVGDEPQVCRKVFKLWLSDISISRLDTGSDGLALHNAKSKIYRTSIGDPDQFPELEDNVQVIIDYLDGREKKPPLKLGTSSHPIVAVMGTSQSKNTVSEVSLETRDKWSSTTSLIEDLKQRPTQAKVARAIAVALFHANRNKDDAILIVASAHAGKLDETLAGLEVLNVFDRQKLYRRGSGTFRGRGTSGSSEREASEPETLPITKPDDTSPIYRCEGKDLTELRAIGQMIACDYVERNPTNSQKLISQRTRRPKTTRPTRPSKKGAELVMPILSESREKLASPAELSASDRVTNLGQDDLSGLKEKLKILMEGKRGGKGLKSRSSSSESLEAAHVAGQSAGSAQANLKKIQGR